jgi:hypothetical protein
VSWLKKHVPVLGVARALGLRIRNHKAKCWRVENHRHGDADPSLSIFEKRNRCRCFVCDMKGGHSNIDLVMGVLGIEFGDAVRWIAERFPVPNVKVGRPAGNGSASPMPYRVGVHGSEWEVIVRSGMWGAMTPAERSILVVLDYFKDPDSGLTRLSYRAIMRYSGVKKMANVSAALKSLCRMGALHVSRGQRIGITRECSAYRVTLDNPKFLELCNAVFAEARQEIAQEREYRASQKRERERVARKPNARPLRIVAQHTNTAGGLCPAGPPVECVSNSKSNLLDQRQETPTCEGLNLSSPGEVHANKALPNGKREISSSEESAYAKSQRDKEYILKHYAPAGCPR